jgi:hypothetical protein
LLTLVFCYCWMFHRLSLAARTRCTRSTRRSRWGRPSLFIWLPLPRCAALAGLVCRFLVCLNGYGGCRCRLFVPLPLSRSPKSCGCALISYSVRGSCLVSLAAGTLPQRRAVPPRGRRGQEQHGAYCAASHLCICSVAVGCLCRWFNAIVRRAVIVLATTRTAALKTSDAAPAPPADTLRRCRFFCQRFCTSKTTDSRRQRPRATRAGRVASLREPRRCP